MTDNENSESNRPGPVIVAAGRRVDAPDATTPRFPAENAPAVRARVEEYLQQQRPTAIVASAACGADLILLQAAQARQVRCYVLLPSSRSEFRKSSVTDRPGNWGAAYDEVLQKAQVEELKLASDQEGYLAANERLLDKAQAVANSLGTTVAALVIWNQESRGDDDVTGHFLQEAEQRNFRTSEISTL